MIGFAPIIIWLNWDAVGMAGLLPQYVHFKNIILSGFNQAVIHQAYPTFPIWGYGWLMTVSENKLFLLLFQNGLSLAALYLFIKTMESAKILTEPFFTLLKFLMVCSLSWYAFHSLRWPNSISISLVILSIAFYYRALEDDLLDSFLLSGLFFGLALNFRSDYCLMPLGLAFVALVYKQNKKIVKKIIFWLLCIYSCLLPWIFYTKYAIGHALLTSTNSGHVCFIGLGNDHDNKWGIEESDGDPVMHRVVDKAFNFHKRRATEFPNLREYPTLTYDSDQFLKRKFLSLIWESPWDYLKKCRVAFFRMLTEGVYVGEFFKDLKPPILKTMKLRYILLNTFFYPLTFFIPNSDQIGILGYLILRWGYHFTVKAAIAISFITFPLIALFAIFSRNLFFTFINAIILYQMMINVLCYHMASYTTNIYFFLVLNFVYALSILFTFAQKKSALRPMG